MNNGDVSSAPITGQQTTTALSYSAAALARTSNVSLMKGQQNMHESGVYVAPVGHPVADASAPGHIASAVGGGTPVMLHHGYRHPPYVVPVANPVAPPPATIASITTVTSSNNSPNSITSLFLQSGEFTI